MTVTESKYPNLSVLMGGYLHQDYDLEYEDDDAAIRDYAATHGEPELRQTVEEFDQLLATPEAGLLRRFEDGVGDLDYIVGETDSEARAWLLKAQAIISGAVDPS